MDDAAEFCAEDDDCEADDWEGWGIEAGVVAGREEVAAGDAAGCVVGTGADDGKDET